MCMKIDCSTCGKPTWKGCGKHIEQALKDVPEDERCKCPRDSCETKASAIKITEETKAETTTTADNEVKIGETKEKSD